MADNLCSYASSERSTEDTLAQLEKVLLRRPHQAEWVMPLIRYCCTGCCLCVCVCVCVRVFFISRRRADRLTHGVGRVASATSGSLSSACFDSLPSVPADDDDFFLTYLAVFLGDPGRLSDRLSLSFSAHQGPPERREEAVRADAPGIPELRPGHEHQRSQP